MKTLEQSQESRQFNLTTLPKSKCRSLSPCRKRMVHAANHITIETISPTTPKENTNQSLSIIQKIKGWYQPVYDVKTPGLSQQQRQVPRYCAARLKR